MKNLTLRGGVALACALALGGCGGDNANLSLTIVSISNLTRDGLTIKLNGGPAIAIPANSVGFRLPDPIAQDTNYDITIFGQPDNAVCTIYDGKGKTGAYSPNSITINCVLTTYNIKGLVKNLTTDGLIINNGSVKVSVPKGATTFTMTTYNDKLEPVSGQVPEGYSYGLTVFQQPSAVVQTPAGQTCTMNKGTGIMPRGDTPTAVVNGEPTGPNITCI